MESTLGVGSTFSLTSRCSTRTPAAPSAAIEPGRVAVLVIEDSDEDLLLYERALASTPFQVVPARSIAAAEVALPVVRPAAIVLDLRLHGEESWDLLARLKRDPATRDIPVIIVSTRGRPPEGVRARRRRLRRQARQRAPGCSRRVASLTEQSGTVRVLTIDDEETARFIVREMLAGANYQVDRR